MPDLSFRFLCHDRPFKFSTRPSLLNILSVPNPLHKQVG
jgi:hypothetical protein